MSLQADRPRSERKARGYGHLRRAELLAAAQRIFSVAGYEGATIRKIADEVGVSSTALYMYFQDKSQIMLELCVQTLETLLKAQNDLCETEPDALKRVRGCLDIRMKFGFEQPTAYQLLYGIVPKDVAERRHEVVGPLKSTNFQRLQQSVEAAMSAGQIRNDMEPRPVTEALVAACHGAITMRLANPYAPWTDTDVMSKVLLDGLFEGFYAR